jgi:DNA-binding MurR/RpiR family transcriptional regulator
VPLESLSAIPTADLDGFIDLLSDNGRWLYLAGGRFTGSLAEYIERHLEQIRRRVCLLRDPWGADYARGLDVGRRDVFIICDVKRYELRSIDLAAEMKRRGCTVVLVTDGDKSPASGHSDLILRTAVSSPSPFDSLATAFV